MQFYFKINDAHIRFITSIGYNPLRHELMSGSEDGLVKFWEVESGAPITTVHAHQGWVTSFLFWKCAKLMMSSSHDGTISIWQGCSVLQTVYLDEPLYKICLDMTGGMLLCGCATGLDVYILHKERTDGIFVDVESRVQTKEHKEIVRCVVSCDKRVFSAGFDQKLVIYDCLYYGFEFLKVSTIIEEAHDAAITCLSTLKDNDNNVWIITGSFDKCVKIWNHMGKLLHKLTSFGASIVDLSVIDRCKVVWVSSGGATPTIFDIRSGEDVTSFSNCFEKIQSERIMVQLVKYFPDSGMMIASTSRRQLFSWRWQTSSAVTRLLCGISVDCICICEKSPILIFCAGGNGQLIQWENRESNDATYQMDSVRLSRSMQTALENKMQIKQLQIETNNPMEKQSKDVRKNKSGRRFLQMVYLEFRDLLVAAAEDGLIYVFGYDVLGIKTLMAITKVKSGNSKLSKAKTKLGAVNAFQKSNDCLFELKVTVDPITMRITGLSCQNVLMEHKNVVTSLVIIPPGHDRAKYFLVSCSWDQRICVWDLETFDLVTKYQNVSYLDRESREFAAEDALSYITYSPRLDQIAYSSVDMVVHIRQFNVVGLKMSLVTRLCDFDGEVTMILWEDSSETWITSSEDHLIRIWESQDPYRCLQLINAGGSVSRICFDDVNEAVIAAVGTEIKIFDIIEERMVQIYCGHKDDIRGLMNIAHKNQFASSGDDGQLLFWNKWARPKKYTKPVFVEDNS